MPRPLNYRIQCRQYRVNRKLDGSRRRSRRFEEGISPCTCREKKDYAAVIQPAANMEPRIMHLIMLSYVIRKMSLNELHALYVEYLTYFTLYRRAYWWGFSVRVFLIGVLFHKLRFTFHIYETSRETYCFEKAYTDFPNNGPKL